MISETFTKLNSKKIFFLILFLGFVLFGASLHNDFFAFDDLDYIYDNYRVSNFNWHNFLWFWTKANTKTPIFFNFLQFVSLIFGSKNPEPFRFLNICFHCVNAMMVYFLSLELIPLALKKKFSDFDANQLKIISILSGVLFLIHPTQVESVVWIYPMRGVMASTGALLSIWYYLKYCQNKTDNKFQKELVLSVVFFLVGMLCKLSIAALPLVFILLEYFLNDELTLGKALADHWLIISLGIMFVFIFNYEYPDEFSKYVKVGTLDVIFISFKCLSHYLVKLFYFGKYKLDYGINYSNYKTSLNEFWYNRFVILGSVLLFVYSFTSLFVRRRNFVTFCFILFFLCIFTGLGFIPQVFQYSSFVADRYLYLGVFPFSLFLGCLYFYLKDNFKKYFVFFISCFVLFSVFTTITYVSYWENQSQFLGRMLSENPKSKMVLEGTLAYHDVNRNWENVSGILWHQFTLNETSSNTLISFAKMLGKKHQVKDMKILYQAWQKKKPNWVEMMVLNFYLEAEMYEEAKTQLAVVKKLPANFISDNHINLKKYESDLLALRFKIPTYYFIWEQYTFESYTPVSKKIRDEINVKGYDLPKLE